jgi:hypothetical protein
MIYSLEDLEKKPGFSVMLFNIQGLIPIKIRVKSRIYIIRDDGLYQQSNR